MECNYTILWNSVVGTLSAVGTLFMTYYIYKLTNKSSKKEKYFSHMVEQYYRLEEDLCALRGNNKESDHLLQCERCAKRIKINSTIMLYYLQRIPGYYVGRFEFIKILDRISEDPYDDTNYNNLSDKYVEFCWEFRDEKKTSHTYSFCYDGKPLKN